MRQLPSDYIGIMFTYRNTQTMLSLTEICYEENQQKHRVITDGYQRTERL